MAFEAFDAPPVQGRDEPRVYCTTPGCPGWVYASRSGVQCIHCGVFLPWQQDQTKGGKGSRGGKKGKGGAAYKGSPAQFWQAAPPQAYSHQQSWHPHQQSWNQWFARIPPAHSGQRQGGKPPGCRQWAPGTTSHTIGTSGAHPLLLVAGPLFEFHSGKFAPTVGGKAPGWQLQAAKGQGQGAVAQAQAQPGTSDPVQAQQGATSGGMQKDPLWVAKQKHQFFKRLHGEDHEDTKSADEELRKAQADQLASKPHQQQERSLQDKLAALDANTTGLYASLEQAQSQLADLCDVHDRLVDEAATAEEEQESVRAQLVVLSRRSMAAGFQK